MRLLLFFLPLIFICCQSPKQQDKPVLPNDTTIAAIDSIIRPAEDYEYDPIQDSIDVSRERDSFYAIRPAAILTGHGEENVLTRMIAAVIDTNVMTRQEVFKEDTRSTYNKDSVPVTTEYIYKSRSYEVRVWHHNEEYVPGRIYINGKEMRMGKDIDTSLSGDWFAYHIIFVPEGFRIMKFGSKEYLYLVGYVHNCNGTACSVAFYMLYDPVIKKAMMLPQFRSDFFKGYDRETGSPAFVDMDDLDFNHRLDYFNLSGKFYRFDRTGKIRKLLNSKGEQFFFNAYTKREEPDSVFVKEYNLKK